MGDDTTRLLPGTRVLISRPTACNCVETSSAVHNAYRALLLHQTIQVGVRWYLSQNIYDPMEGS